MTQDVTENPSRFQNRPITPSLKIAGGLIGSQMIAVHSISITPIETNKTRPLRPGEERTLRRHETVHNERLGQKKRLSSGHFQMAGLEESLRGIPTAG
jgi:hypothetical protein